MPQRALRRQDISAVHHEMARETMPKHMGELPFRQRQFRTLHTLPEGRPCVDKQPFTLPVRFVVGQQLFLQGLGYRYRARLRRDRR